jgi:UDP-N-acetylmuramoylalanine-D-glutamate ligase
MSTNIPTPVIDVMAFAPAGAAVFRNDSRGSSAEAVKMRIGSSPPVRWLAGGFSGGNKRNETRLMVSGFSINMERAWIIAQSMPGLQGVVRADRSAIHGDSVFGRAASRP